MVSIPGSGESPRGRNANLLQYSWLENHMDRGAWWATVHGVAKSRTWLKWLNSSSNKVQRRMFSSVAQSCLTLPPHELQHARPLCPSPTPGVRSDSGPSSPWCHPAISSSVIPFSSHPQSLPAIESFPMSQLFAWGGQSTGASALLVITFLPRSKHLLISWLQSPSAVILEPPKIKSDTLSSIFPSFAMKWWDRMPWSSFSECWPLSLTFSLFHFHQEAL